MANVIKKLIVEVSFSAKGEQRHFQGQIIPDHLIERYLNLEMGRTEGLFLPVGDGEQISAKNIHWFKISKITGDESLQHEAYAL